MPRLPQRLHDLISPSARADRRNISSLARRLGVPVEDAGAIYWRSREVGFGAAMAEHGRLTDRTSVPQDKPVSGL